MSRKLLLHSIKQLVTLSGPDAPRVGPSMRELSVIENAAVFIEHDTIRWCGRQADLDRSLTKDAVEVECDRYVVMPGFVDCHTHAIFAGNREDEFAQRAGGASYQAIAAEGGGLMSTVRATREATKRELKRLTSVRLDRMLNGGTTTVEIKTGYGLTHDEEMKLLDSLRELQAEHQFTIVPTFLGAHAVPPEFAHDPDGYIDLLVSETLPHVARRKLATFADIFCESGYFTVEQSRRYLQKAKELGFRLRLHGDQLNNIGATLLGSSLGAASVDHLEHIDDAGLKALRSTGTTAVALPGTSFFLGGPYMPARRIIDAGVPLAIATNFNPGSNMSYSMPMMMTIACTQMGMTPEECVTATTINAAAVLGLASSRGSIVPGKRADLAVYEVPSYRTIPYYYGENHAVFVVKDGVMYETGM